MIDDHYGPSAGRANLLFRAVDGILGTHRIQRRRPAGVRPDYASASRMERSALIADAVWVFTDPRLMPMTEAVCASLISP